MTNTIPRQTAPEQPSPEDSTKVEVKKVHSKKFKIIAGLSGIALAGTAGIFGVVKQIGESANAQPEPTSTSIVEQPRPTATAEQPVETQSPEVLPEVSETTVTKEQLPDMTPEQITAAARISVESVTVNGEIDWDLYAQKLDQIQTLQLNAGLTQTDFDNGYDQSFGIDNTYPEREGVNPTEFLPQQYDQSIEAGYKVPSVELNGIAGAHRNNFKAAYDFSLFSPEVTVAPKIITNSVNIVTNNGIEGGIVELNRTMSDNLFSSGAITENNSEAIAEIGRSQDLNNTFTDRYTIENIEGNLILVSATKAL